MARLVMEDSVYAFSLRDGITRFSLHMASGYTQSGIHGARVEMFFDLRCGFGATR